MENNDRFMFRVWDIINKKMFYSGYNDWKKTKVRTHDYLVLTLSGNIIRQFRYADEIHSIKDLQEKATDKYILMQSTGLRDKNGKLIFEGDIVKGYFNVDCVEDSIWLDLTDKEKEQGFKIFLVDSIHFGYEYPIPEEIEIIGNKFSNPELLKVDV